jgi:uncharacterized protein YwgA/O-acetyl-ADP-ribose deacetylase (regulator of RNase III)
MVQQPKVGDVLGSKAQTLVNTVNTVGVMGKGIALAFRKRFPDMYEDYQKRCAEGRLRLGEPYLFKRSEPPWILLFPTKDHWRSVSRLADIRRGLEYLEAHFREWGITSLAVPALGCGHGKLEWRVVGPMLYRYLDRLGIPVELYAPHGTPPHQLSLDFMATGREAAGGPVGQPDATRIEPGLVAVVEVVRRLEGQLHHWPVGRTILQKLAYFAADVELPTGLEFTRGSFGPFAANLKEKLTQLVNNGLLEERRLGRMFAVSVGPAMEDASKSYALELGEAEPLIARLTDLFMRMDTRRAELAATVSYAARQLADELGRRPSECEVLTSILEWKMRRRPPFEESEIAETIRSLAALEWIQVEGSPDLPVVDEVCDVASAPAGGV